MKRTAGLVLSMVGAIAFAGCGGVGNCGDAGCSSGSWLVGSSGTLLAAAGALYTSRDSHTNSDLDSIYCIDKVHGWVSGAGGFIMRSSDGGASWFSADSHTVVPLRGIALADIAIGLAVGDKGTILRSEDGGASWKVLTSGTTQSLRAVAMTRDRSLAVIVGDSIILRSTDGGQTFASIGSYDTPVSWRAIKFASDGKLGFIAGAGGELRVTHDGAQSFSALGNAPAGLRGLSVKGDGTRVVAVGEKGLIWKSYDAGKNFTTVDSGTQVTLNAVGFAEDNPLEGWAVGDDSTILSTIDGAQRFMPMSSPVVANFSSVEDF